MNNGAVLTSNVRIKASKSSTKPPEGTDHPLNFEVINYMLCVCHIRGRSKHAKEMQHTVQCYQYYAVGGRNADGAAADRCRAVWVHKRDSHAEKVVQKKQHRVYLRGVRGELAIPPGCQHP